MSSIFTRIISGELPAYFVAKDDYFVAFLDTQPLMLGHTLVVPRHEADYIFDQPNNVLSRLLLFAQGVAKKIQKVVPCARIGLSVVGLEVPHTHVHLIPINKVSDMDFSKQKQSFPPKTLEELAKQIAEA